MLNFGYVEAVEMRIATVGYALRCTIIKITPDNLKPCKHSYRSGGFKENSDAYVALLKI